MTNKLLFTALLTALSSLGAFASTVTAQERPKCYLIDDSGQLTDLTDICNVTQQRSPELSSSNEGINIVNTNNNNLADSRPSVGNVVVGDGLLVSGVNRTDSSNSIDRAYYIDNEIGTDYTAYIRSYRVTPTSTTREDLREQIFQFDDRRKSVTSIIRKGRSQLPFLIYQYRN